jgi:hypothetical protein
MNCSAEINTVSGRAAGAAIAGPIYEQFGPIVMFRSFSAVSFSYILVLLACVMMTKPRKPLSGKQNFIRVYVMLCVSKLYNLFTAGDAP